MKNLLFAVSLVVVASAAQATNILPPSIPALRCSNAQGLKVNIDNYQGIGLAALVTQHPVAKPGQMVPQYIIAIKGLTPLTRTVESMQEIWQGQGFNMTLTTESFVATKTHPAGLNIIATNGSNIQASLSCTAVR